MVRPVTYVEIHSPDLERTLAFFAEAFGWETQPFAAPDYLVAARGDGPGVDTGLTGSRDGAPRCLPVIRVDDLDAACSSVIAAGGSVLVERFTIAGVGHGCYVSDPAGIAIGLHQYDPDAE